MHSYFLFYIGLLLKLQLVFTWNGNGLGIVTDNKRSGDDDLTLWTTNGWVRGYRDKANTVDEEEVDRWNAIPYAEPPVDNLRFRHPQPIKKWEGVKDVQSPAKHCPQISKTFLPLSHVAEDCLYLSVVVPTSSRRNQKKLSVMVWIDGGGIERDTAREAASLDFKTLAVKGQVIVVSVQYRMGSLGFLYFASEEAPGNGGLFDQLMALQFIKENIDRFGGDAESITLFGEAHGADSIGLHLFSKLSWPLFNRAILQAGSASRHWEFTKNEAAIRRGLGLSRWLKCPDGRDRVNEAVACLRKITLPALLTTEFGTKGYPQFSFIPVVEGNFLTELPPLALRNGDFKQTTLIVGGIQDNYDVLFNGSYQAKAKNESRRDFICDLKEIVHGYAKKGNYVHMYYFAETNNNSIWAQRKKKFLPDDLPYILGEPLVPHQKFSSEQVELSRLVMTYWSNFAKTGNPNLFEEGTWNKLFWMVHSFHGQEYLVLNVNSTITATNGYGSELNQCSHFGDDLAKRVDFTGWYSPAPRTEVPNNLNEDQHGNISNSGVSVIQIFVVSAAIIILILVAGIFLYFRSRSRSQSSHPNESVVDSSL